MEVALHRHCCGPALVMTVEVPQIQLLDDGTVEYRWAWCLVRQWIHGLRQLLGAFWMGSPHSLRTWKLDTTSRASRIWQFLVRCLGVLFMGRLCAGAALCQPLEEFPLRRWDEHGLQHGHGRETLANGGGLGSSLATSGGVSVSRSRVARRPLWYVWLYGGLTEGYSSVSALGSTVDTCSATVGF